VLELLHSDAQRRLAHVAALGRTPEVLLLAESDDVAQFGEGHGRRFAADTRRSGARILGTAAEISLFRRASSIERRGYDHDLNLGDGREGIFIYRSDATQGNTTR